VKADDGCRFARRFENETAPDRLNFDCGRCGQRNRVTLKEHVIVRGAMDRGDGDLS